MADSGDTRAGTPAAELTIGDVARKLAGTVGTARARRDCKSLALPPLTPFPLPFFLPQEVTLTLRQATGEGPKVSDFTLTREEVPVKPKAGASAYDGPAGGLFAGAVGPKPPPALWLAMQGMREGGRRTVQVPSDVGCVSPRAPRAKEACTQP